MKPTRNQIIRLAVLGCFASTLTFTASAQDAIEEVYVTATKRQQTLQEVPVAVSVTNADTIEKAQILDIKDLQSVVPSLRITQLQSSANTNFIIRGFGNGANNPGIEPSVGVFIDGVYRSRSGSAISDLPNLERVEVLRGPQSTLFGKNASAGVISVVTAKPSQDFGGSAELTVGNFGQTVARGDVTGGITDTLAYSLSGNINQRDGYFEVVDAPDTNERDRYGVRGQLLWTPTDNSEWRVIADHDSLDENCCGVTNLFNGPTGAVVNALGGELVPNDPFSYRSFQNTPTVTAIETNGISLHGKLETDNYELVSITSKRTLRLDSTSDSDYTSLDILSPNIADVDIDTTTQEFRISSAGGGDFDWLAGYFAFKEDIESETRIGFGTGFRPYADVLTAGGLAGTEAFAGFAPGTFFEAGKGVIDSGDQDNTSQSLFAQFDWHFSDSLTATFGLNHTRDEKEVTVTQFNNDVFGNVDLIALGNTAIFQTAFATTYAGFGVDATDPAAIGAFEAANPGTLAAVTAGAQAFADANENTSTNPFLGLQALQFTPRFLNFPNGIEDGKSKDSATTYTVRFSYDIDDNASAYVSASTGFKATSWNLSRFSRPFAADLPALTDAGLTPNNITTGTRFANPEDSSVIEIGYKTKFEKGALNLAVFNQEIDGFQSNTFNGSGFELANAGKQSTTGFEFDGLYQATDNLTLTMAGALLSARYDSFVGAAGVDGPEDFSGDAVRGVHPISLSTSATYNMEFDNGWTGFLRGDYQYESNVAINGNVPEELAQRQENTLNGAFGIETQNGWQATLWGRNLTDDQFLYSSFPTVIQSGSFSGYPSQPRTYGLTLKKNF